MRRSVCLAIMTVITACAPLPRATSPRPVLSARTLDTTITVGTAEDRRALAAQVQACRAHLDASIQSDANARMNVQRHRAMIVAGIGGATSLLTWLVIRESVRHGAGGLDAAIVLSVLGAAGVHVLQASMLPTVLPDQTYARERAWTNVVAAVESWETTARDLASAQRNAAATLAGPALTVERQATAWQHADNALRSALATCLEPAAS